jgi:hypothetical protein
MVVPTMAPLSYEFPDEFCVELTQCLKEISHLLEAGRKLTVELLPDLALA